MECCLHVYDEWIAHEKTDLLNQWHALRIYYSTITSLLVPKWPLITIDFDFP